MPRPKKYKNDATKTSVEIERMEVVKELCAARKKFLREYINELIRQDMMRQGEYFSNRYFKKAAAR